MKQAKAKTLKSHDALMDEVAKQLLRRLRTNAFRQFWGQILDQNPSLRRLRDNEQVSLARAEFRKALQMAFDAGKEAAK